MTGIARPKTELEAKDPPVAEARRERSLLARVWYEAVRKVAFLILAATGGIRASGRHNIPKTGAALLVSNHLSYLDVFVLGIMVPRPLNYVARSTLFLPLVGPFIRSVGGFPIQRDGMGASGLKETLRRLKRGGIVLLFPEGTRSQDGLLAPLKPGIAVLATRARAPIIPAAVAGTFEAWPRSYLIPRPHPVRVVYGPPVQPSELAGLSSEQVTALLHERMLNCHKTALAELSRDMGLTPAP